MTEQEAKHEAEQIMQLYCMVTSANLAKATALFSVKRNIELLEHLQKEKFIVYFNLERFNQIITDNKMILEELKKL